jgi:hypothetical protein
VTTDAEDDEQAPFVKPIAMVNEQRCATSTYPTPEPVASEHRLAKAAEESQRMVASVITSATKTGTL